MKIKDDIIVLSLEDSLGGRIRTDLSKSIDEILKMDKTPRRIEIPSLRSMFGIPVVYSAGMQMTSELSRISELTKEKDDLTKNNRRLEEQVVALKKELTEMYDRYLASARTQKRELEHDNSGGHSVKS